MKIIQNLFGQDTTISMQTTILWFVFEKQNLNDGWDSGILEPIKGEDTGGDIKEGPHGQHRSLAEPILQDSKQGQASMITHHLSLLRNEKLIRIESYKTLRIIQERWMQALFLFLEEYGGLHFTFAIPFHAQKSGCFCSCPCSRPKCCDPSL